MDVVPQTQTSPTVAVIIPLYNKGQYIARTLDSVFAQTYQNFEVLVVNDGSTDSGPEVAKSYADPRLRVIDQVNAGPGAARNRGIRESTAPWLSFLDADDEWLPEFLETAVQRVQQYPDCVAAVFGHFREAERVSWEPTFRQLGVAPGPWRLPTDLDPHLVKPAIDFFHSGALLCSRTVVERLGGFYDQHRCTYGEDSYLWLQVALNYRVYRDPAPLMWHHTEASELGQGRQSVRPPWPILLEPDGVRQHCPRTYQPLLSRCLAYYASLAVIRHLRVGDFKTARSLLWRFPQTRSFLPDYRRIQRRILKAQLLEFRSQLLANVPWLRQWQSS